MTIISDDPGLDADAIDDDQILEAYLGVGMPTPSVSNATEILDWPPRGAQRLAVTLHPETIAWFQARHANWRAEIDFVLRAWTVARDRTDAVHPSP